MTQQQTTNTAEALEHILPQDKSMALKALISTTENLIDFSEREAQTLAKNDMMNFAVMQHEKTTITERYVQLAREFRSRLEDFRGADPGLLDRLEELQARLGDNSRHNNKIIDQVQVGARKKTQSTLLNAQQLGQNHPVHFPDTSSLLALNEQQD